MNKSIPVFNQNKIQLTQSIFDNDALIFSKLNSKSVVLKNNQHETLVEVKFEGFPFLGIWAKPKANYVCIEPWCGIADHQDHNLNIFEKEGILVIAPGGKENRTMKMIFWRLAYNLSNAFTETNSSRFILAKSTHRNGVAI